MCGHVSGQSAGAAVSRDDDCLLLRFDFWRYPEQGKSAGDRVRRPGFSITPGLQRSMEILCMGIGKI